MLIIHVDTTGIEKRAQAALSGGKVDAAIAAALTSTALQVVAAEKREMKDVFDRPLLTTINSVRSKPANRAKLRAVVYLDDFKGKQIPASKFLKAQVRGGVRAVKRYEKALQSAGVLPRGMVTVPGDAAKMDSSGNMQGGQLVQILAYFKAFPEVGYKANMTEKGRARLAKGSKKKLGYSYFVGTPGNRLPLGIYQRVSFAQGTSAIKPVLIFVASAVYQPRFDFYYVARSTVRKTFPANFRLALAAQKV